MDRLDEIVKLVGSNAVGKKEGHLVVQKYIGNMWLKRWVYIKKKQNQKQKQKQKKNRKAQDILTRPKEIDGKPTCCSKHP